MKRIQYIFLYVLFSLFSALALNACGVTSGAAPTASLPLPSASDGLQISSQMSLVSATSATSTSESGLPPFLKYAVPTSGDYVNDEADVYVFDRAMETVEQINSILCYIEQTKFYKQVNQPTYRALINESLCERNGENQRSSGSNQSSSSIASYQEWIVNVSRPTFQSPQVTSFWLPNMNYGHDETPAVLKGQLTVTAGSTTNNPYGEFELHASGFDLNNEQIFTIAISSSLTSSGEILLQMDQKEPDSGYDTELYAFFNPNTNSGYGYTFRGESDSEIGSGLDFRGGKKARVAFDDDYYKILLEDRFFGNFEQEICLDRSNYTRNVHAYNLYDSAGTRFEPDNQGFPLIFTDDDGDQHWGFAGYYGIYLPEDEVPDLDGVSVKDVDGNTYQVYDGDGRFTKRTRESIQLADIKGQAFEWYDFDLDKFFNIKWDGSVFVKTDEITFTDNGPQITDIADQTLVLATGDFVSAWKQGYGQIGFVIPSGGTYDSTEISHFIEEILDPVEASQIGQLYCYYDCPKGGLTIADLDNETPFYTDQDTPGDPGYIYDINPSSLALRYSSQDIAIGADAVIDNNSFYSNGLRSGPLVTSSLSLPYEIYNQDVIYFYETGPKEWNRFRALIDSGNDFVSFDPPINCPYENDDYGNFNLQYEGPGNLFGIPSTRVTDDQDSDFEHSIAQFSIDDGTELSCNGSTYYVKAIDVEQNMVAIDNSNCSHLTIPNNLTSPTITFTDPQLGDVPVVTGEPKVIGGVIQSN